MKYIYLRDTDEDIKEKCQGRKVTSFQDFNLKIGSQQYKDKLVSISGGVYDHNLFGSVFEGSCNCGKTTEYGKRCPNCGCKVLTEEEKDSKWAYIDLDFYFMNKIDYEKVATFLQSLPIEISEDVTDYLEFKRISKSSVARFVYYTQFGYDEEKEVITTSMDYTNLEDCGPEGLLKVLILHFTSKVTTFKKYFHKYIYVTPASYRYPSFNPYDRRTRISIPLSTTIYQSLLYTKFFIYDYFDQETVANQVALASCIRAMAELAVVEITGILLPSKQNDLRHSFEARVSNSGRAVISADPDLTIDEVGIPVFAAYSILKDDFIKHLQVKYNLDNSQALMAYMEADPTTMKYFKEYAETRMVIVNRPPTLHRYNMLVHYIRLVEGNAMKFPISAINPYNADFDGDALMYYLVPTDKEEEFKKNMLPSNNIRYEANDNFIFKPSHEMIYGLTLCTTIQPNTKVVGEFMNREDLLIAWDNHGIDFSTDEVLVDGVRTTYAYEKLCDILGMDVFTILGNKVPINAKNISLLLSYITTLQDYPKVYQQVLSHALEVVTLEGASIPDLSSLLENDFKSDKVLSEAIQKSKKDPKYNIIVHNRYHELINEMVATMPSDLRKRIEESNRIKMSAVTDIFAPSLIVDNQEGGYAIAGKSLGSSLSYEDYLEHARSNRFIMRKKHEITPKGGYLSRQIRFASQHLPLNKYETDPDNVCIMLPKKVAVGRVTKEGNIIPANDSDELVLVRSVAVSTLPYITPDLLPESYSSLKDGANISLRLGSGATGEVTQSGLSLKHGGTTFRLRDSVLYAPFDCEITQQGNYITIGKIKHPVPDTFILLNKKCKKGEIIGFCNEFITPDFESDYLVDFLGGKSSSDIGKYRESELGINLSPYEGVVSFKNGGLTIGGKDVPYWSTRLYNVVEGDVVKVGDRISDGVLSTRDLLNLHAKGEISIQVVYYLFAIQLSQLLHLNSLMIEFLFRISTSYDENGILKFTGIVDSIRNNANALTSSAFEGAKVGMSRLPEGEQSSDLFSSYLLSLVMK